VARQRPCLAVDAAGAISITVSQQIAEVTKSRRTAATTTHGTSVTMILATGVIAVLMAVFVAFGLTRGIVAPLRLLTDSLLKLARGGVDMVIPSSAKRDEIGEMFRVADGTRSALRSVETLTRTVDETNQSASQVLNVSQQMIEQAQQVTDIVEGFLNRVAAA
jgi:methyl-accepting chemotaxis protein